MDLISVIIPYYKKKEYIISSINSVLNQTYKNLEIIIIYDDLNKDDLNLLKKINNFYAFYRGRWGRKKSIFSKQLP